MKVERTKPAIDVIADAAITKLCSASSAMTNTHDLRLKWRL